MSVNENAAISQKFQERFEFYVIALIFTILGLSIQTATFGNGAVSDLLEIFGWIFLFVSGLVGLSRLEWFPVAYNVHSKIEAIQTEKSRLHNLQEIGHTEVGGEYEENIAPIHEEIAEHGNAISSLRSKVENIEKWIKRKYLIHKWSFVLGLLFLLLSRAYNPVQKIISEIAKCT